MFQSPMTYVRIRFETAEINGFFGILVAVEDMFGDALDRPLMQRTEAKPRF